MRLVPRGGDIELMVRVMLLARLYWPLILLFFLVSMLATPLTLLTPIPLKIVADALVGKDALPGLLSPLVPAELESSETRLIALAAILFVMITLLRQTQELARMLLYTYIGERLTLEFRSRLFGQVQKMSLAYHDSQGTADSVYRIQYDATAVQNLAIEGVIPFVASSVTLIAMIYVIFAIDWQLAIAACAAAPVMLVLARLYQTKLRQKARSVKRLESSAMEVIQEVLGSLRVVKAFGQEEREGERFYERAEDGFQSRVGLSAMEGIFGLLIGLTTAGAGAVVLYIGATHVRSGVLTLGELLLVMGYLSQLYEPLKSASRRVGKMQSSLASAERAFELLDEAPDVEERPHALPLERARGEITFSGVSFGYNGGATVLNRASFRLQPGKRLGVCGVTGAGKTTMISLLTRLYDPNDGKITLDGVDIRDYKVADLRDQFAVVLQEPVLFSTTIAENIAYARQGATFDELVEAATAANAHDFITSLPDGYDTIVGERGMRLSGGERQRVALARAFLKDAPILVLDEPTSSVDHQTEAAIVAAMKRLMAGRTTIMIAHRLSTLDDCDRWLELLPGGKTRLIKEPPSGSRREQARPRRQRAAGPSVGAESRPAVRSTSTSGRKSTKRGVGEPARVRKSVVATPARAAAMAWQRTSGVKASSSHVETLNINAESAVYLLRSAVSDELNVVAKHCARAAGLKESFIYSEMLGRVPGRQLACRGLLNDYDDERCWLFLEEARGEAFSSQNPEHLTAGAYWLSSLHRYVKLDNLALRLPERDIAYYLELVNIACRTVEESIENPAVSGRHRATLEDTLRRCTALAGQERELKRIAALVPATLVHGNLKSENVRVIAGGAGAAFIPFDWTGAGWGTPAIDLGRVDLSTYRQEAERLGLENDAQDLRAVAALGRALWAVSEIPAELSSLAQVSADRRVSKMSDYRGKMASLAETTGWTA